MIPSLTGTQAQIYYHDYALMNLGAGCVDDSNVSQLMRPLSLSLSFKLLIDDSVSLLGSKTLKDSEKIVWTVGSEESHTQFGVVRNVSRWICGARLRPPTPHTTRENQVVMSRRVHWLHQARDWLAFCVCE